MSDTGRGASFAAGKDSLEMSIFKACDIRGTYPDELDEKTFYTIGKALPAILKKKKTALVAGDVRLSTPSLKGALSRGLADAGMRIIDAGIVPTPAAYFAQRKISADVLCIITSSHNPADYNGLKIMPGEMPVTEEAIEEVKSLSARGEFKEGPLPRMQKLEILDEWMTSLKKRFAHLAEKSSGCRVVVDAGNGSMSKPAPSLFRELGFAVEELFCAEDGSFPNREPNSAVEKELERLKERVVELGTDLGIAFDGDGDRVSFIDEKGRFLKPEEGTVLFMRSLSAGISRKGETFVYDNKFSEMLAREWQRLGGVALPERSGHAYIKRRMIEENALFGAEVSGHYFYRELAGGDDGLFSALFMLETILHEGEKLSALAASVPAYFITEDIRIPTAPEKQQAFLDAIEEHWKNGTVSRIDGLKIFIGAGWGLIRKSITEPLLTLRFEARTANELKNVMETILKPVPELLRAAKERMKHA
jgi:phosphomannomutase/phosphoglucomutase